MKVLQVGSDESGLLKLAVEESMVEVGRRRVWRWPSRVCPLELRCRREDKSVERGRSLCVCVCVCVCACARTHMHVCLL